MRIIFLCLSFFLAQFQLQSQNLVPNPSFETVVDLYCGIMPNGAFNSIMTEWNSPTGAGPDLYFTNIANDCFNFQPDSQYSGPIGLKGTQTPRTGNIMAGLWIYTIPGLNQRDYIQIQLSSPMIIGHTYEITYFVSMADFMEFTIDKIGIHLSTDQVSGPGTDPLNVIPQLESQIDLVDVENWMLVTSLFEADDNYEYLTIGNFNSDANTIVSPNPSTSGAVSTYGAYYFLDDFSIVDVDPDNVHNFAAAGASLVPNPASESIRISFENNLTDAVISIFNLQGELMLTQSMNDTNFADLNIYSLSNGTYIVSVQSGSDSLVSRFVKVE